MPAKKSKAPKPKAPKSKDQKPAVNKELEGFEIEINSFGEISSNFPVERINEFLNRHTHDKKLQDDNSEGGKERDDSVKPVKSAKDKTGSGK